MGIFHKPSPPQPPDPAVLAQTQGQMNEAQMRLNARMNRPNQTTPFGSVQWSNTPGTDDWSQTQTYDPRLTSAFYSDVGNMQRLSDLGGFMGQAINSVITDPRTGGYRAFQPDAIPSLVSTPDPNQVIGQMDLSHLQGLPGQNDFGDERKRVEDALYQRQAGYLDPEFAKRRTDLETQLTNQGFQRDTEAWKNAMRDLGGEQEKAYSGARNDAITQGGSEQSRLFADALSGRSQGFNEQQAAANFYNQAAQQDFSQRFQAGQFGNAIRGQRYQEELTQRQQPFNEFMQLVHGNAPQLPQFSNPSQIQGATPPDFLAATGLQQQGLQNAYNQQVGGRNNMFSSLGRIGAAFAGK